MTWQIFNGAGVPHDGIERLPPPPNWRNFEIGDGASDSGIDPASLRRLGAVGAGRRYGTRELAIINAALYLRRPLLVTGKPGVGKSALADAIARELRLGTVLRWRVTSRTALAEGLYQYDAIGRLHDESLDRTQSNGRRTDIGRYVRLGPLGTALLPGHRPRVLLVDELDKGDLDLPNDLLHVLEDGEFEIPELLRLPDADRPVTVMTADQDGHADVRHGRVRCRAFPVIVVTSNGEREFPPAFLRRCVRLDLAAPTAAELTEMVAAHFDGGVPDATRALVEDFLRRAAQHELASDQLLSLVYLTTQRGDATKWTWNAVVEAVLRELTEPDDR